MLKYSHFIFWLINFIFLFEKIKSQIKFEEFRKIETKLFRSDFSVNLFQDKIYIYGGKDNNTQKVLGDVVMFDP